jgi:hypothetical protein
VAARTTDPFANHASMTGPYTDAELDSAVAAITDPARLREAQDVVMRTAPSLQRVLGVALGEGGWFGLGHERAVEDAAGRDDPVERVREVRTLLAEETRLGMLVGVAVGFALARELGHHADAADAATDADEPGVNRAATNNDEPARTTTHEPKTTTQED